MSEIQRDDRSRDRAGKNPVESWLARDVEPSPIRPMWPAVQARIRDAERPIWSVPFALGSGALATAGLVIGIWVGSLWAPTPSAAETDVWALLGSTLTRESSSLYDPVLAETANGSEVGDE